MKILWLSHFLPWPPKGGNLQRTHHLLRQAAAAHEIHLVGLNQRAYLPREADVAAAVEALGSWCASVQAFPIPADSSRARRLVTAAASFLATTSYDVMWLRSRAYGAWVRTLATRERFDLIYVDTLGLMPYTAKLPAWPIVLNHHNIESQMVARRAEGATSLPARVFLRRESAKLAALERDACARAKMNLCVSPLDRERLAAIADDVPVEVVENGVDVDYFRPGPAPSGGARGLIFAGGMGWYPNRDAVHYLVREIWPALLAADPERRLTIIGRSPPREICEAAAADARIRVPGFVDDVRPYMDAAAIYICPIQTGGGTRLKILDALAMAKPLVATRMAVEGLGLEPERHYLEAETPDDYVRQIGRLEGDPALGEALGRAGRAEVERRYAWDAVGRNLRRAFERALSA